MLLGVRHVPDIEWLSFIVINNLQPSKFSLDAFDQLVVPHIGQPIPKRYARTIMHLVPLAQKLAERGAIFDFTGNDGPTITANGITIKVEGFTELETFDEVLIRKNYRMTIGGPTVVIDIGMNVGLASLYFSAHPNVEVVYGYEPFEPTYRCALANFELNPELAKKIVPINTGIDARAHTAQAPYCATINDSLGIHGMVRPPGNSSIETHTIQLEAMGDVYQHVRSKHPEAAILVKIDCEGSEKEIVPALCAHVGRDDRVALNMETHFGYDDIVMRTLEDAGFKVFGAETWAPGQWLMYAVSGANW